MKVNEGQHALVKLFTKYRLIIGCALAFASGTTSVFGGMFSRDVYTGQTATPEQSTTDGCASGEECFAAAAFSKERLSNSLTRDHVAALKLERLRKVMEKFPDSLWAKRAGLLSGVTLIDQNPAEAIFYLRAAQRDFPALDDYIRFWIGEALLHLGDPKEAAAMFEGMLQSIPDSNLLNQATLQVGKLGIRLLDALKPFLGWSRASTSMSGSGKLRKLGSGWLLANFGKVN